MLSFPSPQLLLCSSAIFLLIRQPHQQLLPVNIQDAFFVVVVVLILNLIWAIFLPPLLML